MKFRPLKYIIGHTPRRAPCLAGDATGSIRAGLFPTRLRRWVISLAAAAGALTLVGISAGTASASAEGYTTWGTTIIHGVSVPHGYMYHDTDGSGLNVRDEYAGWGGYLCNWWIDFDFYGAGGKYYHVQGGFHGGCAVAGSVLWDAPGGNFRASTGYVCATIWENANYVTRACNNIHS